MELLGRQETWNITYDHALGETASFFYTRIRDEAVIYGRRCAKTGRVLVLHEAVRTMGPGAEIAALVADRLFEHLDAPVRRLGGLDTPIPQAAELETQWYPSVDGVVAAIVELARW